MLEPDLAGVKLENTSTHEGGGIWILVPHMTIDAGPILNLKSETDKFYSPKALREVGKGRRYVVRTLINHDLIGKWERPT